MMFLTGPAAAAGTTANLSWTAPTTYVGGGALPASDVAYYTIAWTFVTPQTKQVAAPALATTVTVLCGVVSFTLPAASPAAIASIEAMPRVSGVEVDGDRVAVATTASDAVIQRLFEGGFGIRDLEIEGAGLEDAFIALTSAADPAA
jgi:ABC-2 type transport system ATP-binding protein